ncbi:mechanosensitive ion channel domain-containing protein [Oscillatoria sp. FACHB-1406]|uniref:mechanosensitive ion channel domain-containing protein n=1 Tax=Oscillatoria sp. FACHB-1406 TaxID=2692846 RepID=UPI001F558A60|nr:mechanosensitive ion channel domain-containing protein [Oscillatoria sp. FACHB-1406]
MLALFEAPYRVGDRVKIKDYYGEVVGYGLRGIRLQTPDDNLVLKVSAIANATSLCIFVALRDYRQPVRLAL